MELKLTPEEIKDCEARMKAMGFKEAPSSDTLKPVVDRIMAVIKDTPTISDSLMCHGQVHCYQVTDHETIEAEIRKILSSC